MASFSADMTLSLFFGIVTLETAYTAQSKQ